MKPITNLALCVAMLLLTAAGCIRRSPEKQNLLLAVVREKEIRESDLRAQLNRLDPSLRSKYRRNRMALLNEIIEEELLYQHALERNLPDTPEAKKRFARAEQDLAIERLKQLEIYAAVTVTTEEIEQRYRAELARPEGSSLVKSVFYVCSLPDQRAPNLLNGIQRGVEEGLSFPKIASQNSIACEAFEFDSAAFSALPEEMRSLALGMDNRTGFNPRGSPLFFFKDAERLDAERLSPCARRIRAAIGREKRSLALREWLSSQRASSRIHPYEKALDDFSKTDAVAGEVNGVSLTVGDVAMLLEGLSVEERRKKVANKKALLHEAIDRELLRHEAWRRNLREDKAVKEKVPTETRRILVELVLTQEVAGVTPAAREKSRADLVAALEKAASVKKFAQNVKKMYIPPSKEIEDIFGSGTI